MISGYKPGADITVLDTNYKYGYLSSDKEDRMFVLFKDNYTGKKHREVIKNPTYTFYKTPDDVVVDHNLFFIEKENVEAIEVPYKDLMKRIAQETGNLDFFYDNMRNKNRKANNVLHTIPEIFNSDMHIEDHYRFKFDQLYKNDPIPITKSYLDIEVDTAYMAADFPELGECPINAIALIDVQNWEIHVYCLENDEYEGLQEFKDRLKDGSLFIELKDFIRNHMNKGGKERYHSYGVDQFSYKFHFYKFEDEIYLLKDLFQYINTTQPDFCMSWNMPFDIPCIIERCITLGYDPRFVLCPEEFEEDDRVVHYYIDTKNKGVPANRTDSFTISGYTVYLDQLVNFASRRKGQRAFDNMKLDYIGQVIAGIGKLDMSLYAKNYAEFPRKAYKWFIFYNIMDTIVQYCIERIVNDIDFVFTKCLMNNTRYSKAYRQTVYLTNRGIKEFYNDGFIMGNNVNRNNPKPPKFPGALIGDPLNNNDYAKVKINGVPINILLNLVDFDYKSLYPSIIREFNIAPNTQIGKIEIENEVHGKENLFDYDKYSRGGQFLEDLQCGNWLEFCTRWFHLASYGEFLEDMIEYLGYDPRSYGPIQLIRWLPDGPVPLVEERFDRRIPLVTYVRERQDFSELREHVKETAQMDIFDYEKIKRRKQNYEEEETGYEQYWDEQVRTKSTEDTDE